MSRGAIATVTADAADGERTCVPSSKDSAVATPAAVTAVTEEEAGVAAVAAVAADGGAQDGGLA